MRSTATLARVNDVVNVLAERDHNGEVLTALRRFPARAAEFADWPDWVRGELRAAYASKGIARPYSHQAAAAEAVHAGKNVVIVTPTASEKTLCYNLPVINAILENEDTRALYLFPTKALAQDQLAELYDVSQRLESGAGELSHGIEDGDLALGTRFETDTNSVENRPPQKAAATNAGEMHRSEDRPLRNKNV